MCRNADTLIVFASYGPFLPPHPPNNLIDLLLTHKPTDLIIPGNFLASLLSELKSPKERKAT